MKHDKFAYTQDIKMFAPEQYKLLSQGTVIKSLKYLIRYVIKFSIKARGLLNYGFSMDLIDTSANRQFYHVESRFTPTSSQFSF